MAAIRAWSRLDGAFTRFNRVLEGEFGVTGAQLAMLRLVAEWAPAGDADPARSRPAAASGDGLPLADLRGRLSMHPATIGQLLDRLAGRGLVVLVPDGRDRRRRLVRLTDDGVALLRAAPLAGPVRLRHVPAEPERLRRLTEALTDALDLFGLGEYDHDRPAEPAHPRPGG